MTTDTEVQLIVPTGELDWLEDELNRVADAEGPEAEMALRSSTWPTRRWPRSSG
jgi:hypothetical protein